MTRLDWDKCRTHGAGFDDRGVPEYPWLRRDRVLLDRALTELGVTKSDISSVFPDEHSRRRELWLHELQRRIETRRSLAVDMIRRECSDDDVRGKVLRDFSEYVADLQTELACRLQEWQPGRRQP